MPDDKKIKLTGDQLGKIEELASMAERVARRNGEKKRMKIDKERKDTAYGAALEPIMKQGFKGREAGDLADTVSDALAFGAKKRVLHDNPRSPK
jgi:uncharacterized protein YajQ (UPF0234 family)